MAKKQHNLTQAAAILLMSTVIVKLIGALFKIPLSADYALGDLGFGYFSAAHDLYIPIYTLAFSGFPVAIARIVADFAAKEQENEINSVFKISLKTLSIIGFLGFLTILILALPIVRLTDNSGQSLYALLAIAPSVFFCSIASVYRGYFEGKKNMFPTAVSNIIEALGKLCLGLTAAIVVMQTTGNPAFAAAAAMLGITLGTVFSSIYLVKIYKKDGIVPSITKNSVSEKLIFKRLVSLAIPVAIASLSVGIASLIDTVTLRMQLAKLIQTNAENAEILLRGTDYYNVNFLEIPTLLYGIRGKCHTLFNLIPTLTTAIGVGALPLITESFVKKEKGQLKSNTELLIKFSAIVSFPASFGFMALGKNIMELLYGNMSSTLGGNILALYGLATLFAGLSVPMTSLLQAVGRQKVALINIVCGMFLKLLLNVSLTRIPKINIYGAVIGTGVCYVLIFILHFIFIIKALKFIPNLLDCFLKPFIAAVVCAVAAALLSNLMKFNLGTVIAIGVGAVVYLIALILLKGIKSEEIKAIRLK